MHAFAVKDPLSVLVDPCGPGLGLFGLRKEQVVAPLTARRQRQKRGLKVRHFIKCLCEFRREYEVFLFLEINLQPGLFVFQGAPDIELEDRFFLIDIRDISETDPAVRL